MFMTLEAVAATGSKIGYGTAGLNAVLGYAIVFGGLILLMYVIIALGKFMSSKKSKAKEEPTKQSAPVAEAKKAVAPGSAGEIKLYDTPDKDAAMVMAIVADKLGKPLNELRFKSIKEIK